VGTRRVCPWRPLAAFSSRATDVIRPSEFGTTTRANECSGSHEPIQSSPWPQPLVNAPRPAADPVHAVTEAASNVYSMRMARVNITMPEDLYSQAKQAGLNVSQLAQQAIAVELARMAKVAALDRYLAELESELGPTSDAERADAKAWADQVLGQTRTRRSA